MCDPVVRPTEAEDQDRLHESLKVNDADPCIERCPPGLAERPCRCSVKRWPELISAYTYSSPACKVSH